MKSFFHVVLCTLILSVTGCADGGKHIPNSLRVPAYPLITIDPYTSAWSMYDNLYDGPVRHWTGTEFDLIGVLRVDGETYRFMGAEVFHYTPVAGMAADQAWNARYTVSKPASGWQQSRFDDSSWKTGPGAFGSRNEVHIGTEWTTRDVWVRREIRLTPAQMDTPLYLRLVHDDNVEVYINGVQAVAERYLDRREVMVTITDEMKNSAKEGLFVIAAHCENTGGYALLDFGLYTDPVKQEFLGQSAVQQSVDVQATATHYVFGCGPVELRLSFIAPVLADRLELISRPVNYIAYDVRSTDGAKHDVQIYFETSPAWALNHYSQPNQSEGYENEGLVYLKTGSTDQPMLGRSGDDVRIDWGWFYLCAEKNGTTTSVGDCATLRASFVEHGALDGDVSPKSKSNMAIAHDLGRASRSAGKIMVGYDDVYSIQYFEENLRPWWNRHGNQTIHDAFAAAANEYRSLRAACARFDNTLMKEAAAVGGQQYAELCASAYRQTFAAHKLVESPDGELLWLSKENNSNGSIGTVDITYPSAPFFLYYNPELAKGLMNHIFYYSESGKWTKPFPAHDVGTYPLANGQTYGADMPVEESGNMLILMAAIAAVEGHADYAAGHWDVLTVWADYLAENGLDPDNQLCTDDFAGHFAHNVNLSAKAIMGVASYGRLAAMLGKDEIADRYTAKAREMARAWIEMSDDGDHYRLTFDKPGTWSQKYNLVWDQLLGLEIFPAEVMQKELAYYLGKQNEYGLPLDSRKAYTKTDWIMWTATMTENTEDWDRMIAPVWSFYNETVDRVPMSDWVWTDRPSRSGFKARSVVGGFWIKMLEDKLSSERD